MTMILSARYYLNGNSVLYVNIPAFVTPLCLRQGFASKMMAKMGFTGRLGRNEDGVTRQLEVKVRPEQAGLGFGNFKEATTLKVRVEDLNTSVWRAVCVVCTSIIFSRVEAGERRGQAYRCCQARWFCLCVMS